MKEIIYLKSVWLDQLQDEVNHKILHGYVPSGDLIIDIHGNYIQAVVLLENPY